MKTLYISDLDGTLLGPNASLSKRTINILNDLLHKGVLFTIATARSIKSVKYILKDLNITLPMILMNGVCIYDPLKRDYIKVESLSRQDSQTLLSLIEEQNLKVFLYTLDKGRLATYYEELSNPCLKNFYEERVNKYNKPFTRVASFYPIIDQSIIYFALMDSKENLEPLNKVVENLPNINSVFYKDNYYKDMWYLEIFSIKASKYHAVNFLRHHLSIDNIIGFGDNSNDILLFDACDKSYAVDNAIDELKTKADGIIGSNTKDAVAIWIKENS
jgi:Cof subfamily protein (haloacid dehalogenase superfamily)